MDNCCDSMLNKLVAIFDFFLFLIGATLIGVGAYIHVKMSDYLTYFDASVLFIVLGAIVLILGFFGCCGACTENSCMMFTFATLLALVVIAEVCNELQLPPTLSREHMHGVWPLDASVLKVHPGSGCQTLQV